MKTPGGAWTVARAEVTRTAAEPAGRRRWRPPPQPLVLLVCLGLAVWMFSPAWSSPTDTTLRGGGGDPAIFIFFLRWVPFALEHGHHPLVTHYLNYPDGVNLMWNTSLPLPGLLFAPVTSTWGPVLTFNLLLVLAYSLSSWCAYLAIRSFGPGHLAAAVGGLVYGFSPAVRSQGSHLHMSLAFLAPLMLLALHEILVRQRRSPWLAGGALGLMGGCQLLIGEELLAMTALFGLVLFLLLLLGNLRRLRGRVAHTLKAFGVAVVAAAAIAAWPLAVQFTGPQRIQGDIHGSSPKHVNDLYSFVVPSGHSALAPAGAVQRVLGFAGGGSAYLGVPLLLVTVALAVRRRSDAVVRVSAVLLVVAAVLSMGPSLYVGGRDTGVWLPWALFQSLPLLDSMIPSRLAQFTALFAGLLLALYLHAVWGWDGWRRGAAAAVGVAALAPLWPAHSVPAEKVATPAFFTGGAVRTLPRDGVTLVVPFPSRSSAVPMTWQAQADLWFRMPGGYFIGPRSDGGPRFDAPPSPTSQTLSRVLSGRSPPRLSGPRRRVMARDFARWQVGNVIVGPIPNQATMLGFLTDLLGREPERVGGVYRWRDPVVRLADPGRRERLHVAASSAGTRGRRAQAR